MAQYKISTDVYRFTGVNMKSSTTYEFVHQLAGALFIPTFVRARQVAEVGECSGGSYAIGNNASTYDNILTASALNLSFPGAMQVSYLNDHDPIDMTNPIMLKIVAATGGTSLTWEFYLEGYYLPTG